MNDELVFIPTDVDPDVGVRGVDYYCRIKDVVDRLNERRNDVESSVADSLRRGISKPVKKPALMPNFASRRLRSKEADDQSETPEANEIEIDDSWKRGGRNYPTKTSTVGPKFQVDHLPKAGTYADEECSAM